MSLLKKIESDVGQAEKELLIILDVGKSTDQMLAELNDSGKIKLVNIPPTPNEDQVIREAQ